MSAPAVPAPVEAAPTRERPTAAPGLLAALARASAPAERLAGGWLRPAGDPAPAARVSAWTTAVARGDDAAAASVLAARGWTAEDLGRALGDVEPVPGAPLPRWAVDLLALLDLVGSTPTDVPAPRLVEVAGEGLPAWVDPDQPWRFFPGFADWLAAAAERVDGWTAGAPLTAAARRDLVLDLARRQLAVSGPLLMEVAATRPADPLFRADPRGDWETLLDGHPVVGRLLATAWRQWQQTTEELAARLRADLPGLAPGRTAVRLELSAGDQHDDGRGVVRVRLDDGASWFLKPRSDRLHHPLGAVLAGLDRHGPPLGLELPELHDRGSHVWVPQVPAGDCADEAAVDAWFFRAGALLRVLQALGATDLHHENFVPTDRLPVLVDLETVVAPGPLRAGRPVRDAVTARMVDTPGGTSMVTSAISGPPGRVCPDIGALAGPATVLTPYEVRSLVAGPDGPELRSRRVPLTNGAALPTLAGRPVGLRGHEDALLAGHAEAQRRLAAAGVDDLLATAGPSPLVRFVARPTRTYARLLQRSLDPAALTDGVARELVLDRLHRATGTADERLIAAEVDALRELDIPLFAVPFDTEDLHGDRGRVLPGLLTASPRRRTRERLRAVAERDDHADDLRATLFCADPEAVDPDSGGAPGGPAPDPVAVLLDRALPRADGSVTWIGLEHDPNRQRWSFGPVGAGLTGQAGIGLALALVVAAGAGPDGCRDTARAALLGAADRVGSGATGPADAFSGPAGVLFACATAARALDDPGLRDAATGLVGACLTAARRDEPSSVVDGAVGAALALTRLADPAAAAALAEATALARRPDTVGLVDPPDRWTAALPSRAAGRALVLDGPRDGGRPDPAATAVPREPRGGRWFGPSIALDTAFVCGLHGLAAVALRRLPGAGTSLPGLLITTWDRRPAPGSEERS